MNLPLHSQLINLFAAIMLLLAFAMLSQRRILSLINLFALQGLTADAVHAGGGLQHRSASFVLLRRADFRAQGSGPALEHAVIGNIVPDFPLINKSFNLSYSGHDL